MTQAFYSQPTFDEALLTAERVIRAELWRDGRRAGHLPIVPTGAIDADATTAVRRSIPAFTVRDVLPSEIEDSDEVRLFGGVIHHNGVEDLRPLGVFCIDRDETQMRGYNMTMRLYDRMWELRRRRLRRKHVITGLPYVTDEIRTIIEKVWPEFAALGTFATTQHQISDRVLGESAQHDLTRELSSMAASAGCEFYVDRVGAPRVQPIPDINTLPVVAEYTEGEGAWLIDGTVTREYATVYDAVVVEGVADDGSAIHVEVGDEFGAPYFLKSKFIRTKQQAVDAGTSLYQRVSRAVERVAVSALTNYDRDLDDVVVIRSDRTGVDGMYLFEQMRLPINGDPLTADTRSQRR